MKFPLQAMQEQNKKMAKMVEVAEKDDQVDLLRTEVRVADLEQSLEETNLLEIQKRLLANLMGLDLDKAKLKFAANSFLRKQAPARPIGAQGPGASPGFRGGERPLASQARRVDVAEQEALSRSGPGPDTGRRAPAYTECLMFGYARKGPDRNRCAGPFMMTTGRSGWWPLAPL